MHSMRPSGAAAAGRGKKRPASALSAVNAHSGRGMMGAPCHEEDDTSDEESNAHASGTPRMPKVRVGNRTLTMHTDLVEMRDSTALSQAGRFDLLRKRLDEDGFIFVRGVMKRETVQAARTKMLTHLHKKGAIRAGTEWTQGYIEYEQAWNEKNGIKPKAKATASSSASASSAASKKMIPGWTVDAESGGLVGSREPDSQVKGWHAIGNSRELTSVYNGAELKSFYQNLFSQDDEYRSRPDIVSAQLPAYSTLPACTWLRAKGPGEVTAEHADYYYFYKNTHIFRDFWREPSATAASEAKKSASQSSSSKGETKEQEQSDEDLQTCQICHDPRDPASTLLCDLCDRGFHMSCLTPRILRAPEDEEQEWHCYECQNKPMNYWTCWTPMGDIAGHDGRLALIPKSHRVSGYESPVREDLLPRDFTKSFELKSVWQTPTRIGMGDIILFNIKTIHAATKNAGEKFRLSLDTRVTTHKGRAYCEANGIEKWETPLAGRAEKPKAESKEREEVASCRVDEDAPMVDVEMRPAAATKKIAIKTGGGGKLTSAFQAKKQRVQ